jgi:hypothetical protein
MKMKKQQTFSQFSFNPLRVHTNSMKFPTVEKFLCHFDLVTGGLVIGFYNAAFCALLALDVAFRFIKDKDEYKREVFDVKEPAELSPIVAVAEVIEKVVTAEDEANKEIFPTWREFLNGLSSI